jgi:hypothetical protein
MGLEEVGMSTKVYSFEGQNYVSEEDYRRLEAELRAWESIPTLRGMRPIGTNDYIISLMQTSKYFEDGLARQQRIARVKENFLKRGIRK